MLIFDQLKKNDPQLRILAVLLLCGMFVLVAGLWWVQIVSSRDYQAHLEMQSFRTVRIPAVRGKILDRNGIALAENRATYNVNLYLDELRKPFEDASSKEISRARAILLQQAEEKQRQLARKLNKEERKQFTLSLRDKGPLRQKARYEVASHVVAEISRRLGQPLTLNPTNFQKHYDQSLALPLPIATNLSPQQIAIFSEQCTEQVGVDLSVQSTRFYPFGTTAGHLLGHLQKDDSSAEGEDAYFSYRLTDFRGVLGIEAGYDKELRGKAGVKSVVVNNLGYRQTENIWEAAQPGQNIVLTLDKEVQRKAETALQIYGPTTRGACVVMDVQTGDVLVMASSPAVNPNDAIQGYSDAEIERLRDPKLRPEINRATQDNYAPGSIFKTIVGLACLEAGLDPNAVINNPGYYEFRTGGRRVKDLAAPGQYDFKKALMKSSNTYFIENGLRVGIEAIIRLGQRLHLGEKFGLPTRQEAGGIFPTERAITAGWHDGDTANICIGQGKMAVTPLQMAVMISAIANGGRVLWPRLVDRIEAMDPTSTAPPLVFEKGHVRDNLGVHQHSLQIVREAMLADVEEGGTGSKAFIEGLDIGGKTGTAQVMDAHNRTIGDTVWFASFAPYEKPRWAVIVMIETDVNAGSGGSTCAPIAKKVYQALLGRERGGTNHIERLAQSH